MGRFQELYRLPNRLYQKTSPIIIEAGALQKDTVNNTILAQIKFNNISSDTVIACKVNILCYEINETTLIDNIEYSYLDLNAKRGESFGSKEPIYLPNNTRKIAVNIKEVVLYTQGTIVINEESTIIPKQEAISEGFTDASLLDQYEHEVNVKCTFLPIEWEGLFLCTCGTVNQKNEPCSYCGATFNKLKLTLNENTLSHNKKERLEKEKTDAIELEKIKKEQAEKNALLAKKKRKKCIIIACLVTVLLIVGFSISSYMNDLAIKENLENYAQNGTYEEAVEYIKTTASSSKTNTYLDYLNNIYLTMMEKQSFTDINHALSTYDICVVESKILSRPEADKLLCKYISTQIDESIKNDSWSEAFELLELEISHTSDLDSVIEHITIIAGNYVSYEPTAVYELLNDYRVQDAIGNKISSPTTTAYYGMLLEQYEVSINEFLPVWNHTVSIDNDAILSRYNDLKNKYENLIGSYKYKSFSDNGYDKPYHYIYIDNYKEYFYNGVATPSEKELLYSGKFNAWGTLFGEQIQTYITGTRGDYIYHWDTPAKKHQGNLISVPYSELPPTLVNIIE